MQISNAAVAALVHDVMVASAVAAAVVLHIPLKQLLSLLLQSCPLLTWLMFLLLLLLLSSSSPSSSSSWLLLMLLLVLLLMFFSLEASRAKSLILQKLLFLPVINAWNNLGRFKKRASSVFNVGYFAKKLFSSSRKKEPGKCFFSSSNKNWRLKRVENCYPAFLSSLATGLYCETSCWRLDWNKGWLPWLDSSTNIFLWFWPDPVVSLMNESTTFLIRGRVA